MKEDLSLYGKELNYANAIWSAAYVFGQVPSNLLLTRVCIAMILFSTQIDKIGQRASLYCFS
jgi:ACS family pantothenate transporter-like MFS transporter